tara:strand:- start:2062 stop:2499 length:438 start_codon:yes stop_codon:yes gene_type:complete
MPSVFKYNGNEIIDSSGKLGASTMDANQACVKTALNATGSAPIYACRAWVRFPSSSTITASGNVSSITDHGVGDFTINFTTAMQDANYAVTMMSGDDGSSETLYGAMFGASSSRLAGSFRFRIIRTHHQASATDDATYIGLAIFR